MSSRMNVTSLMNVTSWTRWNWISLVLLSAIATVGVRGPLRAEEPATPAAEQGPAPDAKQTAVALNYCRAAFHRIRKRPSREVLHEEQEKILNNLNLSQLADPEVIQLYTSVLDEINQIGLADQERTMYRTNHTSNISRKLTWDAVALGTDLATAQFGSAIRTGANSWWDYRNMAYQRDNDLFKVDKSRMTTVMQKSSQFLDTFWRLAQKKHIPDRWLVRGDDLDALEGAMREADPEVRLRILRRMEPFMEAYPPYWYYMGRTQQELGQLPVAIETYRRLEALGRGHFRKDDMLATAMANRAAIEDHLGDDSAVASARKALEYSTDVWEANLICARVLQREGDAEQAEDAILRNLDVALETTYSRVFLASLYVHEEDGPKLAKFLANPQVVADLPAPLLLRSAAILGPKNTPDTVIRTVMASLRATPKTQFGNDELMVRATSVWQLHIAQLRVYQRDEPMQPLQVIAGDGFHDLRFAGNRDWGNPVGTALPNPEDLQFTFEVTYPDATVIRMTMANVPGRPFAEPSVLFGAGSAGIGSSLRIVDIQVGEEKLAFNPDQLGDVPSTSTAEGSPTNGSAVEGPTRVETAKPILDYLLPLPKRTNVLPRPRTERGPEIVTE